MPAQEMQALSEVEESDYRIVRVDDSDPEFLDWVRLNHLMPGQEIEITSVDKIADVIEIDVPSEKRTVRLGRKAASGILVERLCVD